MTKHLSLIAVIGVDRPHISRRERERVDRDLMWLPPLLNLITVT